MPSIWDDLEEVADSYSTQYEHRGTIQPASHFNVDKDVQDLQEAMKGFGSDEEKLINILTQRSSDQRQQIRQAFEEATGDSLLKELKCETHKTVEDALVSLLRTPAELDAHELAEAMKGPGAKEKILTEIFATRTNRQIKALNAAFVKETEYMLVRDLKDELSGDFQDAVVKLNEANRDESTHVDRELAEKDAAALYEASEKKWGTDEKTFIEIMCTRSFPQLQQTIKEYKKISEKSLQECIESEMNGDMEELMDAIVKCVKSVPAYFAELLHDSMKGFGTDEKTLCRVMVSRSEIDLMDIRKTFKRMYEKSLHAAIESDMRGDCAKCMLAICGGDD